MAKKPTTAVVSPPSTPSMASPSPLLPSLPLPLTGAGSGTAQGKALVPPVVEAAEPGRPRLLPGRVAAVVVLPPPSSQTCLFLVLGGKGEGEPS